MAGDPKFHVIEVAVLNSANMERVHVFGIVQDMSMRGERELRHGIETICSAAAKESSATSLFFLHEMLRVFSSECSLRIEKGNW